MESVKIATQIVSKVVEYRATMTDAAGGEVVVAEAVAAIVMTDIHAAYLSGQDPSPNQSSQTDQLTVITRNKLINHGVRQPANLNLLMKRQGKPLQKQKRKKKAQLVGGILVLLKLRILQLMPMALLPPKALLLQTFLLHQSRSPSLRTTAVPTLIISRSKQRKS